MARLPDKYRPDTLDEIVGQDHVIPALKRIIARTKTEGGVPPHCLFIGPPGCGKTSAGIAMAKELWGDKWTHHFKEFNASDVRKIDDVRTRYKVLSQHKGDRMLLLDEADRMTIDAQHAMRRIMEKTKSTCFILTGNSKDSILDAIESRCVTFVFKRLDDKTVLKQILKVCQAERIGFENKQARAGLMQLARDSRGDLRGALNNLVKLIGEGKSITTENVMLLRRPDIAASALMKAIDGDSLAAREIIEKYVEWLRRQRHEELLKGLSNSQQALSELRELVKQLMGGSKAEREEMLGQLKSMDAGLHKKLDLIDGKIDKLSARGARVIEKERKALWPGVSVFLGGPKVSEPFAGRGAGLKELRKAMRRKKGIVAVVGLAGRGKSCFVGEWFERRKRKAPEGVDILAP